ncbi:Luminal-binding protein [Linum grandiflorum]
MLKVKAEKIEEDVKPAITKPEDDVVIGIDLGTTFSCVAVAVNGDIEIIANDQNKRTTPSSVAFSAVNSDRLIGEAAKNQAAQNPLRTVFDVKRLIGKKFENPVVQKDIKYLPYKVVNSDGRAYVELELKPGSGEFKAFSPEEISAMVLGKMKETAESFLRKPVSRAVVTVPAYFNDAQREATKNAGTIAGLDVVQIINEPTAAAIAYGFQKDKIPLKGKGKRKRTPPKPKSKILVYDLGGGTFDVSVLEVHGREFRVLAVGGDTHLGGGDFDRRVMEYFVDLIKRKHNGRDISGDSRALARLRKECERAKRALSNQSQVTLQIESFLDGETNFSEPLSRAKFDDLNMDLFKTTMDIVKTTLEDGKVKISEVDEIVLVGGSTRIVKVREMLKELFNGKEPNNGVNPDEAVAFGAAVLAAKLSGQADHSAQYGNVTLIDVIPLSLGMEVIGGLNCIIIPKNTVIPVKRSGTFYTVKDWQTRVFNKVVQGDRPLTKDCIELGRFYLDGITPALRGVTIIDRTLEVDVNGILTVTAKERRPGAEPKSLTIIDYKGFLTQAEIERMTREAKMMSEEDAIAKERVKAMNDLEKYIYDVKTIIGNSEIGNMMSSDDRTMLESAIQEDSLWLDVNKHSTKEVYDEKKKELGDLLNSIVTKVHNNS